MVSYYWFIVHNVCFHPAIYAMKRTETGTNCVHLLDSYSSPLHSKFSCTSADVVRLSDKHRCTAWQKVACRLPAAGFSLRVAVHLQASNTHTQRPMNENSRVCASAITTCLPNTACQNCLAVDRGRQHASRQCHALVTLAGMQTCLPCDVLML